MDDVAMSRIAIVTGANQGLGFALADGLARRLSPEDLVYLTGRDAGRVEQAAARITAPSAQVRTQVLDVRDGRAVMALAEELHGRHAGVDIVLSNAAARLTPDKPWTEQVEVFVDTNKLRHDADAARLRARAATRRPPARCGQRLRYAA
jgi:carbonyl reductase 1